MCKVFNLITIYSVRIMCSGVGVFAAANTARFCVWGRGGVNPSGSFNSPSFCWPLWFYYKSITGGRLNILGVRMSDRMDFTPHINYVTTSAVQSTYALRVLRAHGLSGSNLWDVTRAMLSQSSLMPALLGGVIWDSVGKARIQSVLNKLRRLGFLAEHISFDQICLKRDTKFFSQILTNPQHVLHQLLPPVRNVPYSLRPRVHDRELPVASAAMRKNFCYSHAVPEHILTSSKNFTEL